MPKGGIKYTFVGLFLLAYVEVERKFGAGETRQLVCFLLLRLS